MNPVETGAASAVPVLISTLVQFGVVLGIWTCLLVDVIGNWAGQNRGACWVPIMQGTIACIAFILTAMKIRLLVIAKGISDSAGDLQRADSVPGHGRTGSPRAQGRYDATRSCGARACRSADSPCAPSST